MVISQRAKLSATSKIKGVINCYDALQTFLLINLLMFGILLYFQAQVNDIYWMKPII